jgi:hypothetical protein
VAAAHLRWRSWSRRGTCGALIPAAAAPPISNWPLKTGGVECPLSTRCRRSAAASAFEPKRTFAASPPRADPLQEVQLGITLRPTFGAGGTSPNTGPYTRHQVPR